jgi:hypothetical protein
MYSEQEEDDKTEETFQQFIMDNAPDDIPDEWSVEDRNKLTLLNWSEKQEQEQSWKEWLSQHIPNEFLNLAFEMIDGGIYTYKNMQIDLSENDKKYIKPAIIKK